VKDPTTDAASNPSAVMPPAALAWCDRNLAIRRLDPGHPTGRESERERCEIRTLFRG